MKVLLRCCSQDHCSGSFQQQNFVDGMHKNRGLGFQLDTPHQAITLIWKSFQDTPKRLGTSRCFFIQQEYDVANCKIAGSMIPFLPLLERGEVLLNPPSPEHVCQVLHVSPSLSGIAVLFSEDTWGEGRS